MTANAMQGDQEKCIQAGMDDYIAKPVEPNKLKQILKQWSGKDNFSLPDNKPPPPVKPNKGAGMQTFTSQNQQQVHSSITEENRIPVFDHNLMRERLMQDNELFRTVTQGFITDMENQIKHMQHFIKSGDVQQAFALAHKIKGASANVSGLRLSALATKMELMGKDGDINALNLALPQLENEFRQLKNTMEEKIL